MPYRTLGQITIILCLTAAAYLGLARAEFVYEDLTATGYAAPAPMPIRPLRTRWLTRVSYRLDRDLGGNTPLAYHRTNLGLHLADGALVGALAGSLAGWAAAPVAAGIFLLHPLNRESVAYIASRTELLSTGAILIACLAALAGWWPTAILFLVLACSAKESAICGVGLLLLVASWKGRVRKFPWAWWKRYWPWGLAGGAALALLVYTVWMREYSPVESTYYSPLRYAALQATAVLGYLWRFFAPVHLTVDHDFEIVPVWGQYLSGWVVFALACGSLLLWWGRHELALPHRWKVFAFSAVWIVCALALRFVMRIPETLNEHQLYLAMVGASIAVAAGVSPMAESQTQRS